MRLIPATAELMGELTRYRRACGSHQSDQVDLKLVRDNLGHASIATTNTYLHAEDDVRHDATSQAHRAAWLQPGEL